MGNEKSALAMSIRRDFIRQTSVLGSALALAGPARVFAANKNVGAPKNISAKGYAGTSTKAPLKPWAFERRPVGDNDILINIKFSGICHSDIHTVRGHWGPQQYPQVVGHEIAGIVTAVGKNVTKFKIGDKAGVGCMVDSCLQCESCKKGEEHHCETTGMLGTYGAADKTSPTGITQGGYSNNLVVRDHFAIKIPDGIDLQHAAPLLCSGITTYSPMMQAKIKKGDKIGIIGIGGLGHIAIKLAASKGAEVYAFTTSESKKQDILRFGAKEVIVVDSSEKLKPYAGKLDYMLSTVPYAFDMSSYANCVKPYGTFTQVGMPVNGELKLNNFLFVANRVNFNGSMIGGIPETQEVINYCAEHHIVPEIQVIPASQINDAWDKVVNKQARYRYVIDIATI
jgi:uncharacterized zinc-type alcohol dehydrogenase-like protein